MENRADEDGYNHCDEDDHENATRLGRVSKPRDFAKHSPHTAHTQFGTTNSLWLKPQNHDEVSMVEKSSNGILCSESYFSEDAFMKEITTLDKDAHIKKWDDQDQFQLHHEAL